MALSAYRDFIDRKTAGQTTAANRKRIKKPLQKVYPPLTFPQYNNTIQQISRREVGSAMARTLAAEDDKVARRAEISRQAAGAAPDNRGFTTVTVWGLVDKSPSRTSLHAAPAGLFQRPTAVAALGRR